MTVDRDDLPRFRFGDSDALADELLALVLAGTKTATCWPVGDGQSVPAVGSRAVALDSRDRARAVLETVALEQRAFEDVEPDFASAEGEGDRSLGYWRHEHRRYFERNGGFQPDMMLWCERFRLVEVLPTD